MDRTQIKHVIEAALLAAGRPLPLDKIAALFAARASELDKDTLVGVLDDLATDYKDRGLELKEVSSGYRIQIRSSMTDWLTPLWEERAPRYTRALLETLALIAYRQPITRAEIEEVRGVAVSTNITRTLLERNWIRVVGHRDVPGKPAMFGTTRDFLDYFGLKKLEDLPTLAELKEGPPEESPQSDLIDALSSLKSEAGDGAESSDAVEAPEEMDTATNADAETQADADGDVDVDADVDADADAEDEEGRSAVLVIAHAALESSDEEPFEMRTESSEQAVDRRDDDDADEDDDWDDDEEDDEDEDEDDDDDEDEDEDEDEDDEDDDDDEDEDYRDEDDRLADDRLADDNAYSDDEDRFEVQPSAASDAVIVAASSDGRDSFDESESDDDHASSDALTQALLAREDVLEDALESDQGELESNLVAEDEVDPPDEQDENDAEPRLIRSESH